MMKKNNDTATLKSLETLRIIAAIAVVFAHSGYLSIPLLHPLLGGNLFLGSIGVDIFFVVSGFVMGVSSLKSGSGVQAAKFFLIGRLLRLFPLYILCTLAATVILLLSGKQIDFLYLLQSIFLLPTFRAHEVIDPIVYLGWTLRFEFYFYILVALGIALDRKILIPLAGILASVAAWLWFGYYYGAPIILEFIAGFLLSFYRKSLVDKIRARAGFVPFFIAMLASVALLLFASTGHDWGGVEHGIYGSTSKLWIVFKGAEIPRIISWGIPAFLLVYFCLGLEADFKWQLSSLGKYTYGVYLFQYFVIIIMMKLKRISGLPDILILIIGVCILAIGSLLSFRYVESPALKQRYRFAQLRNVSIAKSLAN